MNKFLEKYNLPKLSEEEAESLSRPITADKMEALIKKNSRYTKALDQMVSQKNSAKHLRKSSSLSFIDYSKKSKMMEDSQTLFMKPASS